MKFLHTYYWKFPKCRSMLRKYSWMFRHSRSASRSTWICNGAMLLPFHLPESNVFDLHCYRSILMVRYHRQLWWRPTMGSLCGRLVTLNTFAKCDDKRISLGTDEKLRVLFFTTLDFDTWIYTLVYDKIFFVTGTPTGSSMTDDTQGEHGMF